MPSAPASSTTGPQARRRAVRRAVRAFSDTFRRAPLGILVLAVLLGVMGVGLLLGAVHVFLSGREFGPTALAAAFVFGPLCLYLAVHLIRLSRWAWLAMMALVALLLISSTARAVLTTGPRFLPVAEIAVELLFLVYLRRRDIRGAFGRD